MNDPNDLTTVAPEFINPPALAFFDLVASASTTHKSRYALRVAGLDAEDVMRCLVLTWDGVWHPASPTTGNLLRPAAAFRLDQRGRYEEQIVTRTGAHKPGDLVNLTIWEREDGTTVEIYAHVLVEVLP